MENTIKIDKSTTDIIDQYSTNSNNDIALFASSSVANPYTFTITTNKSFSATCEIEWSGGGK